MRPGQDARLLRDEQLRALCTNLRSHHSAPFSTAHDHRDQAEAATLRGDDLGRGRSILELLL